jgi:AbiV family abortive infection protein
MTRNNAMKLTKEILFEAVTKSIKNAEQLIDEGKILKAHGKLARAYTLYQLAIEEVGKALMTYGFLLFDDYEDEEKQKSFLTDFRDHKIKTKKSAGIDFMIAMTLGSAEIKKVLITNMQTQLENTSKFNDLKNYSLYTSLIENTFLMPEEIISEKIVNDLEFYAVMRQKAADEVYNLGIKEFDKILEARKDMDMDKLFRESADYVADMMKI